MSNDVRDALAAIATLRLTDHMGPHDMALRAVEIATAALAAAPAQPMTCDGCGKPVRPLLCGHCAPASEPQAVRNVDDLRDAGADAEQAAIDSLAEPQFDFARAIHYPEHWDMAAYPTLESAIWEALSCAGCSECKPASGPQAEPQPEAIPIAPVEVVRQALKELLESISECRMDQVTARFAKASVMARAVVDRYKDAT